MATKVPGSLQTGLTTEMTRGPAIAPPPPIAKAPALPTGSLQIDPAAARGAAVAPPIGTSRPWQMPDLMRQIYERSEAFRAPDAQITQAAQSLMPMYQSRLSGLEGPTANAMRLSGQQAIQQQYGNALRSAMSQAGAQGIRGPAAMAMQGDIRNQMGLAQGKFERDLMVADWEAKRQALGDYANIYRQQAGLGIGTPTALQQLQNTQAGFDAYNNALGGMYSNAAQRGPGFAGVLNPILQPQTMVGLPSAPGMDWLMGKIS
jgi:hypothetical protein